VGVAKRNRYAKTVDKVNPERGIRIALDRAYRDIYDQTVNLYGRHMLIYSASTDPSIRPKEFAFLFYPTETEINAGAEVSNTPLPPFEETDASNGVRLKRWLKKHHDEVLLDKLIDTIKEA
jgi:hypothetical protein